MADLLSHMHERRFAMPARPVMTLHAPMGRKVADRILSPAIDLMEKFGFKWWLNTDDLPNLVLMIDSPDEWTRRGPSEAELDHFFTLWNAGHKEDAQTFVADGGFPPYLR